MIKDNLIKALATIKVLEEANPDIEILKVTAGEEDIEVDFYRGMMDAMKAIGAEVKPEKFVSENCGVYMFLRAQHDGVKYTQAIDMRRDF